ncbi:MAG: glycosyltransferase family 4 protein [Ignavibacteriae bacterium]|nr:glycosyltransferase family 4 protein [Ignavibacteriota bacterium]MCB9214519.1 glycosyltransferase family 4 protein [Ignavibacteria bacterium]
MKVCLLAQQSVSMVRGGPLVQLRETVRYLPEFGVEVEYFDQWRDFPRSEFDLVHIFNGTYLNHDVALRLYQFGIPFVVSSIFFTMRSHRFIRTTRKLAHIASRYFPGLRADYAFIADICQMSRMVLPNTTDEAAIIERGLEIPPEKIRVVPNGVDPRFADADPYLFESEYGLKDFVLNVGHIGSGRKNVLNLIRAMKEIDRPLVVVGKVQAGSYAEACLREAGANPCVTIIEGLPNDAPMLASAYAACDTFALPSLFETPGIAALEAALAGAKIVITPHGGTHDYFGEMATYVEPKSVSAIVSGISHTLSQPKSPELRQHILQEFTWRQVAEKTAAAYRDALK